MCLIFGSQHFLQHQDTLFLPSMNNFITPGLDADLSYPWGYGLLLDEERSWPEAAL